MFTIQVPSTHFAVVSFNGRPTRQSPMAIDVSYDPVEKERDLGKTLASVSNGGSSSSGEEIVLDGSYLPKGTVLTFQNEYGVTVRLRRHKYVLYLFIFRRSKF